jgi:hypothetical protein
MQALVYAEKSVDHEITLGVVFPSVLLLLFDGRYGKVVVRISR